MLWISALVSLVSAASATPVVLGREEFLEWSANDRYAVWAPRYASRFVIFDAARGSQLIVDSVEAFALWNDVHPVMRSEASPEDTAAIRVTADTGDAFVETRGEFTCHTCTATKTIAIAITRGSASETVRLGAPAGSDSITVSPHWSPRKTRVAVALQRFRNQPTSVLIEPTLARVVTVSTTVELLATAPLDPRIDALIDAICLAGFPVTGVGAAQKARATSVVFAKDSSAAEARAIAALIPGGASIEPLTWKAAA